MFIYMNTTMLSLAKIITLVFNTLEAYRQKVYVSPRVVQLCLNYLRESVRHAFSWKIVQNNIVVLIQDIIYPLLCINDDDIELFNEEPVEFVRARLGRRTSRLKSPFLFYQSHFI